MYLTPKELEALKIIRNYLVHNGKPPSIRQLKDLMGYSSPRSASFLVDRLVEKNALNKVDGRIQLPKIDSDDSVSTINVPLVGAVSCGTPVLAEENIETYIPISTNIAKPGHEYFLLRADGDSMDQAEINDGDYVLVKQQLDAESGDYVVALIDNESTVKELQKKQGFVSFLPRSSNPNHKPIILDTDASIQGVVVTSIPKSIINN